MQPCVTFNDYVYNQHIEAKKMADLLKATCSNRLSWMKTIAITLEYIPQGLIDNNAITLEYIPQGLIDNKSASVQVTVWWLAED